MDKTLVALVAVVLLHLAVTVAHGAAHTSAGVNLGAAGLAFVVLVIEVGPLAGLFWLRVNPRAGALLVGLTMLAALLFGVVNHFVIPAADRVDFVAPPWRVSFGATAVLLAITEAAGALLGLAYGRRAARMQT